MLEETGITKTEAAATSFLTASNVMRTMYVHQVVVAVLDSLLRRAKSYSGAEITLEDWISSASQESPTFKFWSLVHNYQQIIPMFIRAHRKRKFEVMVSTLEKTCTFILCSRSPEFATWVPIFI